MSESEMKMRLEFMKQKYDSEIAGLTTWMTTVDGRLRMVERLSWIAVGGIVVIGAITSIVGGNIMRILAH